MIFIASILSIAHATVPFVGVNIAGLEFNDAILPGILGQDYFSDPADAASLAIYTKYGMNTFRLPILWDRLQPVVMGPLDPTYLALVQQSVANMNSSKAVILDLHNYGSRNSRAQQVGIDPSIPVAAVADVWSKLATVFLNCNNCMFGIQNEPLALATNPAWGAIWAQASALASQAIRATGATQTIIVSQTGYSSMDALQAEFASLQSQVTGLTNFMVDVHVYYDNLYDVSTANGACVSGPKVLAQMADVTTLLRSAGMKAIVGEFVTNRLASCNQVAQDIANLAVANSDVWQGLIAWGGGANYAPYSKDIISLLPDPVIGDSPMLSQILGPVATGTSPVVPPVVPPVVVTPGIPPVVAPLAAPSVVPQLRRR
jgi:endoglucanase